jgi:hypothetical protein
VSQRSRKTLAYPGFVSNADLALVQFHRWMTDFVEAIESRPTNETPDQMLAATLGALPSTAIPSEPAF